MEHMWHSLKSLLGLRSDTAVVTVFYFSLHIHSFVLRLTADVSLSQRWSHILTKAIDSLQHFCIHSWKIFSPTLGIFAMLTSAENHYTEFQGASKSVFLLTTVSHCTCFCVGFLCVISVFYLYHFLCYFGWKVNSNCISVFMRQIKQNKPWRWPRSLPIILTSIC